MVAGKQIDVLTAGLIVGKPTPTGFCGSWLASERCWHLSQRSASITWFSTAPSILSVALLNMPST